MVRNPSPEYRAAAARLLTHALVAAHLELNRAVAVTSLKTAAIEAASGTDRKPATPWVAGCYVNAAYWLSVGWPI